LSQGPANVTQLLVDLSGGDQKAAAQLVPLVYKELRRLAGYYMREERPDHTLQATALVHEAYLRLVDQRDVTWQNRAHFFGVAAQMMRYILVDHARIRHAAKRGGESSKLSLDEGADWADVPDEQLLTLDDALNRLAALNAQQSRIIELRFFGGLTVEETAEVLGISPATVKREWRTARAWLHREVSRGS
jgi:RNA polymerase sigma factor (TIGR02999 family)